MAKNELHLSFDFRLDSRVNSFVPFCWLSVSLTHLAIRVTRQNAISFCSCDKVYIWFTPSWFLAEFLYNRNHFKLARNYTSCSCTCLRWLWISQANLDEIILDYSDWWLHFDSVNFSPFYYTINFYLVVNTDCGLDKQNGYIKLPRHNYNFNHEELSFWLNLSTILSIKALHTCLFACQYQ